MRRTLESNQTNKILYVVGFLLIGLGLILNEWILAAVFSPNGVIESAIKKTIIWSFDLTVILVGLFVIRYRNRMRVFAFSRGNLALLFFAIFISFLVCEGLMRLTSHRPWTVHETDVLVEPGDKLYSIDSTLGYVHLPGTFKVTLGSGYSFKITHLSNSRRITQSLAVSAFKELGENIWIFGCSYTYGWSLNDEETYPWLMQEQLPQYKVVNFGVNGYGTLHSLIQFRELLKKEMKPTVAVIAYASFHDERNTFSRYRRKDVAPHNKLGFRVHPAARINSNGKIDHQLAEVQYQEISFMRRSAFIHFLENLYNMYEIKLLRSHDVSKAIIKEFSRLALEKRIKLVVAGITSDPSTADLLEYCRSEGILAVDISVDLAISENNNLPHDSHPSAKANEEYAYKLTSFLREVVYTN